MFQMVVPCLMMSLVYIAGALGVSSTVDTVRVDTSEGLGLPAQWKKVALVFAGHHYRLGGPPWPPKFRPSLMLPNRMHGVRGTTDWRVASENHHDLLIGPLAERGITVDVYFHTWPSHRPIETELVEHYKPIKYTIASSSSHDSVGVDSRVEALKLIVGPETYNAIILTRFELILAKPLDRFPIQPHKLNVPFRELDEVRFRKDCRTSDLMYIFPPKYLDGFRNGSWAMGHALITNNPLVDKSRHDGYGCPQWQEHISLMSWAYGASGDGRPTPLGYLSRDVATIEAGPYYGYSEGLGLTGRLSKLEAPLPKA
jgi:hypothetical protein